MLRILHIIDSVDYNGLATQLLLLAKGLRERGFDVHVCALNQHAPRAAEYVTAGIPTTVIPRRWELDPLADWQLARHVRRLKPDVVHTWNTIPGMFGTLAVKCQLIVGQYRMRRWRTAWDAFMERRFSDRVNRYVTDSPTVRDWCVRNGLQVKKFTVIPSGVAAARRSDVSREELLRKLALPADAKLIGIVGRLVPEKRVKDLIWAADLLRVLHDNLRVLIIGDGPLRAQLEEYARLASDADHIQFLGAGDDVWRIMPHLDVLWNGSENVGQSSAILEAMAAGVPVIASDTPTNREVVVENETGYLIPLGNRAGRAARARLTDRILTDATLAARLGAGGQRRVDEDFCAEQMIENHTRLYEKILS
jgi:glycosyltransferase involved in cell wall biosynthesis